MNSAYNFTLYIKGNCSSRPHFQVPLSGLYIQVWPYLFYYVVILSMHIAGHIVQSMVLHYMHHFKSAYILCLCLALKGSDHGYNVFSSIWLKLYNVFSAILFMINGYAKRSMIRQQHVDKGKLCKSILKASVDTVFCLTQ